jgi:hypothetical protein
MSACYGRIIIQDRQIEAFRAVMLTGAMIAAAETMHITLPAGALLGSSFMSASTMTRGWPSRILPHEKKESAVAFLKAAVIYYMSLGVKAARTKTRENAMPSFVAIVLFWQRERCFAFC